jgi:hypothetical protein
VKNVEIIGEQDVLPVICPILMKGSMKGAIKLLMPVKKGIRWYIACRLGVRVLCMSTDVPIPGFLMRLAPPATTGASVSA